MLNREGSADGAATPPVTSSASPNILAALAIAAEETVTCFPLPVENSEVAGGACFDCSGVSSTFRAFAIACSETTTAVPDPVVNPPNPSLVLTVVTGALPFTALSSLNRDSRDPAVGFSAESSKNLPASRIASCEIFTALPPPVVNPANFGAGGVVVPVVCFVPVVCDLCGFSLALIAIATGEGTGSSDPP